MTDSAEAKRRCQWCSTLIPAEAMKCPNCRSWRKDINSGRILFLTTALFSGAALGWGLSTCMWKEVDEEFSPRIFFTSASGWSCLLLLLISIFYYVKVSRKLRTWWWI